MKKLIRSPEDFWAGLMFIAIGLGATQIASGYSMGSGARMGPGYFPTLLGCLLAAFGAVSVLRSMFRNGEPVGRFSLKTAVIILAGVVLFGLALETAGLFAAVMLMVVVGGTASLRFKLGPYLAVGAGLAAFCALVFVKALGLPMPVIGSWLTGG